MTRAVLCLLLLLVSQAATAQSFEIDEARPADGAADVPLEATVRFEFNDAVDQKTDLNLGFMVIPRRSVRISKVALIPDDPQRDCPSAPAGQTCPSVVEYTVRHEPDTDYTWLAYAVRTRTGKAMTSPFVLRYTTASTLGQYSVSGNVESSAAATVASTSAMQRDVLRTILNQLEQQGYGQPVFRTEREPRTEGLSLKTSAATPTALANDPHTLILLVDDFTLFEAAWDLRAAMVIDGRTGSFAIEYVRPGSYYPLAVRYTDGTRREIEALGYYDADGDAQPDPFTVNTADVSGVNLPMQSFALRTASDYLSIARDSATQYAGDQTLLGMRATIGARPAGTAYAWTYHFYSREHNMQTIVDVDPLNVDVQSVSASSALASYPAIPASFINSDEALRKVLDEGGDAFLDPYRPENINTVVQGGPMHIRPEATQDTYWQIRLFATTSTTTKTFDGLVNMSTGEFTTTTDKPILVPEALRIERPYPNPFAVETQIPLQLQESSEVTLVVYDMLGRLVATIIDQAHLPAGKHTATWEPHDLPNGLYVLHLHAGTRTASRALTLVR